MINIVNQTFKCACRFCFSLVFCLFSIFCPVLRKFAYKLMSSMLYKEILIFKNVVFSNPILLKMSSKFTLSYFKVNFRGIVVIFLFFIREEKLLFLVCTTQ